jgi:hypothetical protein
MLDLVDNEAVVLAVLGDRYRLPVERLAPGQVAVAEAAQPGMPVRALDRKGGAVVAVAPAWSGLLRERLDGTASLGTALDELAGIVGGQHFSWVARTGVAIAAPSAEVTVLDTTDPRLPEWVIGHFSGEAWVVLDDDGQVLSTAVLKRYDDRLRRSRSAPPRRPAARLPRRHGRRRSGESWPRPGRAHNHDATNQLGPGRRAVGSTSSAAARRRHRQRPRARDRRRRQRFNST